MTNFHSVILHFRIEIKDGQKFRPGSRNHLTIAPIEVKCSPILMKVCGSKLNQSSYTLRKFKNLLKIANFIVELK